MAEDLNERLKEIAQAVQGLEASILDADGGRCWVWIGAPDDDEWLSEWTGVMVDANQVAACQLRRDLDEDLGFILELHTRGGGTIFLARAYQSEQGVAELMRHQARVCKLLELPLPPEREGASE